MEHSINPELSQTESEISLIDILCLLKSTWNAIALAGLLGLSLSFAYLTLHPKQYETIPQIAMAQISAANNNLNPLGINIEEPALLIAPIYVSDVPVVPKKRMVLAAGLFGGLFLGLPTALGRQLTLKIKGEEGGAW